MDVSGEVVVLGGLFVWEVSPSSHLWVSTSIHPMPVGTGRRSRCTRGQVGLGIDEVPVGVRNIMAVDEFELATENIALEVET